MVALSVAFVLDFSCSTPLRHAGRGSAVGERVFEIKSQLMSAKYKWKLLTRPSTHTVTGTHTHTHAHIHRLAALYQWNNAKSINRTTSNANSQDEHVLTYIHTYVHTYRHNFVQFVCVCVRGMQTRSVALASAPSTSKRKTAKITTVDGGDDPRKTLTHAIRVSKRAR